MDWGRAFQTIGCISTVVAFAVFVAWLITMWGYAKEGEEANTRLDLNIDRIKILEGKVSNLEKAVFKDKKNRDKVMFYVEPMEDDGK